MQDLGRWDELAAAVAQEGQARVVIAGLPMSGKRMLLNRLRGWDVASMWRVTPVDERAGVAIESYGSFLLADLTEPQEGRPIAGDELLLLLGDPALVVYVVDAGRGVLAADYRWVALLRAGGRPVLVALNSITACDDQAAAVSEAVWARGPQRARRCPLAQRGCLAQRVKRRLQRRPHLRRRSARRPQAARRRHRRSRRRAAASAAGWASAPSGLRSPSEAAG